MNVVRVEDRSQAGFVEMTKTKFKPDDSEVKSTRNPKGK